MAEGPVCSARAGWGGVNARKNHAVRFTTRRSNAVAGFLDRWSCTPPVLWHPAPAFPEEQCLLRAPATAKGQPLPHGQTAHGQKHTTRLPGSSTHCVQSWSVLAPGSVLKRAAIWVEEVQEQLSAPLPPTPGAWKFQVPEDGLYAHHILAGTHRPLRQLLRKSGAWGPPEQFEPVPRTWHTPASQPLRQRRLRQVPQLSWSQTALQLRPCRAHTCSSGSGTQAQTGPQVVVRGVPQLSLVVTVPQLNPPREQNSASVSGAQAHTLSSIAPHVSGRLHAPHNVARDAPQLSKPTTVAQSFPRRMQ